MPVVQLCLQIVLALLLPIPGGAADAQPVAGPLAALLVVSVRHFVMPVRVGG